MFKSKIIHINTLRNRIKDFTESKKTSKMKKEYLNKTKNIDFKKRYILDRKLVSKVLNLNE